MIRKNSFKTIRVIAPIYGLGWILNNLELEKNIKIRFINEEKENKFLKEFGFNWIKYKSALEINYIFDENDSNEPYPALQFILDKILACLRVFHSGSIGFAGIISQQKVNPFPLSIDLKTPSYQFSYKIDKDKLIKFPEFYQKFKNAYQKKQVAFDWFSKSYLEAPVGKVIEFCICLENLFVPLNSHEKKTFILQGLTLLHFSKEAREKIRILYKYRNAIVHADHQKQLEIIKEYKITKDFYDYCEKILRKILKFYIEKSW